MTTSPNKTPHKPADSAAPIRVLIILAVLGAVGIALLLPGSQMAASHGPSSHQKRSERRLYPGAPPVIPHPPISGKCVTCHTPEGTHKPPLGYAPANPHTKTPGMSAESRCRQCHVFKKSTDVFVESDFVREAFTRTKGTRAHAKAPPTIPHPLQMRDDCNSCHTGDSARPEIKCTHPERTRCTQCHVYPQGVPDLSIIQVIE